MHADGKSTLASVSNWNSGKVNSVNCVQLAAVVANNEVKSRRNRAKLIFQVLFITIFFIFFSLNYSKNVAIVSRSLASVSNWNSGKVNSVNCVQLAAVVANNEVKSRRNRAKLIFQVLFITIFLIFFSLNYSKNVAIVSRSFIFSTLVSKPCPTS